MQPSGDRPVPDPALGDIGPWPTAPAQLERVQDALARSRVAPWRPASSPVLAGVWFTAPTGSRGDHGGERAWASAVAMRGPAVLDESVVAGHTGAGYRPGRLAMREGPLLERAARRLAIHPDVVFVNATGRDHPRGAGLALHLGAVLSVPTIGVTDRPLVATGTSSPGLGRGEVAFLGVNGSPVAVLVRTRAGVRPVVVHPGWRTDLATAVELVLSASGRARTPEPLRRARRLARLARAAAEGRIH